MKKVPYRLNVAMRGHQAGDTIRIEVDQRGVPLDQFWRNRLRDAERDGCMTKQPTAVKKEAAAKQLPSASNPAPAFAKSR